MSRIAATAALLVLAVVAAGLADLRLNDSRLFYAALGRDRLVAACLPELRRGLLARGFLPNAVEFEPRPRLSGPFGSTRSLGADFTFQDGPAETRIDGTMACEVGTETVRIEFRTVMPAVRLGGAFISASG